MPTFRLRPYPITATQWFPMRDVPGVIEQQDEYGYYGILITSNPDEEGLIIVNPGDWVIVNRNGSYGVREAEEFERMYEEVE